MASFSVKRLPEFQRSLLIRPSKGRLEKLVGGPDLRVSYSSTSSKRVERKCTESGPEEGALGRIIGRGGEGVAGNIAGTLGEAPGRVIEELREKVGGDRTGALEG